MPVLKNAQKKYCFNEVQGIRYKVKTCRIKITGNHNVRYTSTINIDKN